MTPCLQGATTPAPRQAAQRANHIRPYESLTRIQRPSPLMWEGAAASAKADEEYTQKSASFLRIKNGRAMPVPTEESVIRFIQIDLLKPEYKPSAAE